MKVTIDHSYYAGTSDRVDLPISDWSEIDGWYIKWGKFFYRLKGEKFMREIKLSEPEADTKRPYNVEIFPVYFDEDAEDFMTDYDITLDEA